MILNKKFLNKDFIGRLCVCAVRFNITNFGKDNSMLNLSKLLSYIIDTGIDIVAVLTEVYEAENPLYLKILGYIFNFKILNPSMTNEELKQKLINLIENKVDNSTFVAMFDFLTAIFLKLNSNGISNITIDKDFERMLKFINMNTSIKKLDTLYSGFYENDNSVEDYEATVTELFKKYQNSIVSKDIYVNKDEGNMAEILSSVQSMSEDVRGISILEKIRFLEKKRVAIAVGVTNSGKSMFLCHCAAEYLIQPKFDTNTNIIFYFTFENSREETLLRIMANVLEIEIDTLKEQLNDDTLKAELGALFLAKIDPNTVLEIIELPPKKHSMTTVRAEIQKKLLAYKNAIVYAVELDYVDKMIPVDRSNKTKRFDQQLGDVVDDFKALTNEFETAGISVSQINREGAKSKKADGNINMTHIGGSWEKVENADIVLVLDVDEDMFEELGYVSVIIKNEKHRYSKEGSLIPTMFKPQYSKFYANPDAMRKMDAIDSTCGGNIADDALAHTLSIKAKKNKP